MTSYKIKIIIGFMSVLAVQHFYGYGQEEEGESVMIKKQSVITEAEPNTGMESGDRQISIDLLNKILSDEFILLTQTLNYHWNLVGPEFNDYHKLLDDQYHKIFEFIDSIAERVRAVGGIALGSMAEFIKIARLKEQTGDIPAPKDMIRILLEQHESLIRSMREAINATGENNRDMGTNNFLTDLMEKHEKIAWMLRSLLERR